MKIFNKSKEFKSLAILFLVFLFVGFLNGTPFLFGDSYGYYHVAETLTSTGGYPASIEPEYYPYSGHAVSVVDQEYITPYSAGQSILWYPFLLASSNQNESTTFNNYYKAFNGHSLADGLVILLSAIIFGYLGFLFNYLLLKNLNFSKKVSFFSALGIYLSVYLISYTFEQPGYSHVYEYFCYSVFLYLVNLFLKRTDSTKKNWIFYLAIVFAGLLTLIRIVDVVLVIPVIIYVLYKNLKNRAFLLKSFAIGVFILLLWFLYNYISYKSPFSVGYTAGGASSGFGFTLSIFNLLFSDSRGLFIWSPITLLSLVGLINYSKSVKQRIIFFILPIGLLFLIYNFWINWWGGYSVGQRFFIVLAPLFAIGLANFYTTFKNKKFIKIIIFILVLYSFILSILVRLTPLLSLNSLYRDSQQSVITPSTEDYRVSDIFNYHLNLIKSGPFSAKFLTSLRDSFNGGRSLALLTLGLTDPIVKVESLSALNFKFHFIPNNVNSKIVDNINVSIKFNGNVKTYTIVAKDLSSYSSGILNCNIDLECISEGFNIVEATSNALDNEYSLVQYKVLMSVEGLNYKINFVNGKLK